jgi:predicted negative regulator of RcsB-dependent stress response
MEDRMAINRYKGKKSLKQPDEFITFSSRLLKQILLHRNKAISVLGGIVAVGLVVSGANYLSQKSEADAFLLLKQAVAKYESIQKEGSSLKTYDAVKNDLEEISGAYGNKMGGKLANLFLADNSYAAGEFNRAEVLYRKAVKDFEGDVPFEFLAKSSLGYSLEQQGKHQEAVTIFSEMPSGAGSIMGDESLFALSRQYASLGKTDQQLETAKKLIETYPKSIYIDMLKEKFPGLGQPES